MDLPGGGRRPSISIHGPCVRRLFTIGIGDGESTQDSTFNAELKPTQSRRVLR